MKKICGLMVILCLSLTACNILGPVKTPPINTYTLTLEKNPPAISAKSPDAKVLLIVPPIAAPGYQTAEMIYTLRPFELSHFSQNRWAAPPAEMLTPLLVQSLQSSGCFSAVVAVPFTGNADLTLDARLLNLQQEFSGDSSQVRMTLKVILTDNQTRQVMLDKRLEVVVPSAANNPYAGVIAANKATSIIMGKVNKLLCK